MNPIRWNSAYPLAVISTGGSSMRRQSLPALALLVALVAGCAAVPTPAVTGALRPVPTAVPTVVPGEIVVRFAEGADDAIKDATRYRFGVRDAVSLGIRAERWKIDESAVPATLAALAGDPVIAFAQPNGRRKLLPPLSGAESSNPTFALQAADPELSKQWHLGAAKFPDAWTRTRGKGIIVAVIDSGVDPNHPDLKANLLPLIDEVVAMGKHDVYQTINYDNRDSHGHGTHVCGLVGAIRDNGIGGSGGAPEVKILPVKVTPQSGDTDDATIAKGITDAVDKGARVLNLSIGGEEPSAILLEALNYGFEQGAISVIAAGNNAGKVNYPAAYAGVIAVGATTESGEVASYSCFGRGLVIVAPGGGQASAGSGAQIYSTMPTYVANGSRDARLGVGYGYLAGTSMAAPIVSAAAALVLASDPALSPAQVRTRLAASAKDGGPPGWDEKYGYGALDAGAAVNHGSDAGLVAR